MKQSENTIKFIRREVKSIFNISLRKRVKLLNLRDSRMPSIQDVESALAKNHHQKPKKKHQMQRRQLLRAKYHQSRPPFGEICKNGKRLASHSPAKFGNLYSQS